MYHQDQARPNDTHRHDTIASRRDLLRPVLWGAAIILAGLAAHQGRGSLVTAAIRTAPPFLTLAGLIAAGSIAERLGAFGLVTRFIFSDRLPALGACAGLLGFTALISAGINLDVAAVVAPPLAIQVAAQRGLDAGRLAVATALTANATSFLLPSSNLTSLLVLDGSPISTFEFARQGWMAWLLVTVLTIGCLVLWVRRATRTRARSTPPAAIPRPIVPAVLDLFPMFLIASAIRALLGVGLSLHGGLITQFLQGSLLAAAVNNLPAAAAVGATSTAVPWAAIWSMAMGPNLLITGSVASLICRRIALDRGIVFDSKAFSLLGATMLPLQFVVAWTGLNLAGLV